MRWPVWRYKAMKTYSLTNEHDEQSSLMRWAEWNHRTIPELRNLFAIPNGGWRHPATAARLKAEGVSPGVPDLFLAWPSCGFAGLFIEMKRKVGGHLSPAQQEWREKLTLAGYRVEVCKGSEAAKSAIINYLKP